MNSFSNEIIDFSSLPNYKAVELTPIASRYKKVVLFNLMLSTVIILAIAVALSIFVFDEISWLYKAIFLVVLALFLLFYNVISLLAFKRKSFAFREQDVIYRSGVISISHEIVPYNRLQHVVLKQGWLSRILGLATVECYTAASANNEVAIPGLELNQAEQIKNMLLHKINAIELKEEALEQGEVSLSEVQNDADSNQSNSDEHAAN